MSFFEERSPCNREVLDCEVLGTDDSYGYLTLSSRQRALVYLHAFEIANQGSRSPCGCQCIEDASPPFDFPIFDHVYLNGVLGVVSPALVSGPSAKSLLSSYKMRCDEKSPRWRQSTYHHEICLGILCRRPLCPVKND